MFRRSNQYLSVSFYVRIMCASRIYDSANVFHFYLEGCISADEEGRRLFLSDSNHHRIIVSTGGGEILDCVCLQLLLNSRRMISFFLMGAIIVHLQSNWLVVCHSIW